MTSGCARRCFNSNSSFTLDGVDWAGWRVCVRESRKVQCLSPLIPEKKRPRNCNFSFRNPIPQEIDLQMFTKKKLYYVATQKNTRRRDFNLTMRISRLAVDFHSQDSRCAKAIRRLFSSSSPPRLSRLACASRLVLILNFQLLLLVLPMGQQQRAQAQPEKDVFVQ
jgi:hypothetical protein